MKLRKQFPNYFAGFDIVDVEDPGPPLLYFIDELLYPSQMGVDLPYFFHSGETGEHVDFQQNLSTYTQTVSINIRCQ